jgi:hypothetical protein
MAIGQKNRDIGRPCTNGLGRYLLARHSGSKRVWTNQGGRMQGMHLLDNNPAAASGHPQAMSIIYVHTISQSIADLSFLLADVHCCAHGKQISYETGTKVGHVFLLALGKVLGDLAFSNLPLSKRRGGTGFGPESDKLNLTRLPVRLT